jgi:hypothetical protein
MRPGSGRDFIAHVSNDRLIQLAFEGKRGMDEAPEPPPMSHADFVGAATAWHKAAAIGTPGAAACACAGLQ